MTVALRANRYWLLPAVLILFLLEVITFPIVVGMAWAGRSESPDHVLTYAPGSLTWDSHTGIDENGVAELSVFDAEYSNVQSVDGDAVVAPGTDKTNIVRLKNDADGPIEYTAVLYQVTSTPTLPIEPSMESKGATETDVYTLPKGVEKENVVRAVTGTVDGGKIQDFDIHWVWDYFDGFEQDIIDTMLGDKAVTKPDLAKVGLYVVVEDDRYLVLPSVPKTGDETLIGAYAVLLCISGAVLVLLLIDRKREEAAK